MHHYFSFTTSTATQGKPRSSACTERLDIDLVITTSCNTMGGGRLVSHHCTLDVLLRHTRGLFIMSFLYESISYVQQFGQKIAGARWPACQESGIVRRGALVRVGPLQLWRREFRPNQIPVVRPQLWARYRSACFRFNLRAMLRSDGANSFYPLMQQRCRHSDRPRKGGL